MSYLELTRLDGSTILINKNSVVAVYSDDEYTVILYSGNNKQRVKETYNEIKTLLSN